TASTLKAAAASTACEVAAAGASSAATALPAVAASAPLLTVRVACAARSALSAFAFGNGGRRRRNWGKVLEDLRDLLLRHTCWREAESGIGRREDVVVLLNNYRQVGGH